MTTEEWQDVLEDANKRLEAVGVTLVATQEGNTYGLNIISSAGEMEYAYGAYDFEMADLIEEAAAEILVTNEIKKAKK